MRFVRRGLWVSPLLLLVSMASSAGAQTISKSLPRYDVAINLNVSKHLVRVCEVVTWTNTSSQPVNEIVFNAHSHYSIPEEDIGFLAKMAEILRMSPKESMSFDGPALEVEEVRVRGRSGAKRKLDSDGKPITGIEPKSNASKESRTVESEPVNTVVAHRFPADNATALTIPLPVAVGPGESVTVELNIRLKLPQKKGRWGQWNGITTLSQWLPVVAVHDDKGWQPTPFIPWHQPFFNEAGVYTVKVRLPSEQKLAASGTVGKEIDLEDGWKEITFEPICVRDFALIASARFQEWVGKTEDGITIRVLAPPEHAFYAQAFLETAQEAIPVYSNWFGRYPYRQFTVVEGSFGWAGNECGGLVMIDDRMFSMPHIAKKYPTYLLQHEICHQWWYNVVGTNGYAETWMDEGLATYFSHRLADRTMGKNNPLIDYPNGLRWLPNIQRDDFRNWGMIGTWARGEAHPTVQDLPEYKHLVNLTSATYDRGSKVVGLIEERMGEQAFFDFMRHIYRKYHFRILRVADFQRELEAFTGHSWEDFFRYWVYGSGRCDWAIERVEINEQRPSILRLKKKKGGDPVRVTVYLKQNGGFNEPTSLGIRLQPGSEYQVRVPIHPDIPALPLDDVHAFVVSTTEGAGDKQRATVKVEIALPSEPLQISVDPDRILLDSQPTNNHWKREFRWRLTPLYTQLDEVDVVNNYDRWNITAGPWIYFTSYSDPWYTKSLMGGFRASMFRTQELDAAAFVGYRSNDRNFVAGADVLWDHVLAPEGQLGLSIEQSLATVSNSDIPCSRAVLYARYILMHGSALYLPPFEYVELFGVMQNRCLPDPRISTPGADLFRDRTAVGLHYHKNLLTPYWDPEGGFSIDATYQFGLPIFGTERDFHQLYGQFALVKDMSKVNEWFGHGPILDWLADTRWAFRVGAATALPNSGLFFALGGGDNFRGFDLNERQGSMLWLGSVEWRVPLCANKSWDFVDHVGSVRNVYLAPFYDVGNAYVNGRQLGANAHAVGLGLRMDINWLGMIERTTLRFDIAQTVNGSYPLQFWFGLQHPF